MDYYVLIRILNALFKILEYAILIDVILSYVMRGRENQLSQIIHAITEPILSPCRKIQEKLIPGLMIDFSPVLAILIISVIKRVVFQLLIF